MSTSRTEFFSRASHSITGTSGVEVEGVAHRLRRVAVGALEAVDGDREGDAAPLEVVDAGEAVLQPPGVGEHDGAERALRQLVPQEPEAVLAGRAEQVEHQVCSLRVMRPKSMATVVVVLASTPAVSSTGRPASVSGSSVRSGRISLTAPTSVVLPTPNPRPPGSSA